MVLGEEGCCTLRIHTIHIEWGEQPPIPATGQQCWLPSSQQQPFAFLLLFALEQQLKLSTKIELATMHTINTTST